MNNLQETKIISIYADYQGYSICALGYDYGTPKEYYILGELGKIELVSHNQLNRSFNAMRECFPISKVVANNQTVADSIVGYSPIIAEFTPEEGIFNLMGLVRDSRIHFGDYALIYQEEIDRYSPDKNNHKLNSLFLALTQKTPSGSQGMSIMVRSSYAADMLDLWDTPSIGEWSEQSYRDMYGWG